MNVKENTTGNILDDRILAERGYTVSKVLGEGSYGKVFLANYNPKTGAQTILACKIIDGRKASEDFMQKYLPREINVMRRVNHPAIMRIHSIVDLPKEDRCFIFMQLAENGDLMDYMIANGTVKEKQARVWYSQLILGMGFMHGLNIAHRDLKLDNLFLNGNYNIKIADFGFSRHWRKMPYSETYCGTLSYAAPEIMKNCPYDPLRADLWSMAVCLFVMVNKSFPFDALNVQDMYKKQVEKDWKFTSKASRTLSVSGKEFIKILLEPEPNLRLTTGSMWRHPWIQDGITEKFLDHREN